MQAFVVLGKMDSLLFTRSREPHAAGVIKHHSEGQAGGLLGTVLTVLGLMARVEGHNFNFRRVGVRSVEH